MPIDQVLDLLRCPHCGCLFEPAEQSLRCASGHHFDVARQGYVNLLPGPPPRNADTSEMVAARERFLVAGHYNLLLDALEQAIATQDASMGEHPVLIDTGAGPGWYLAGLLERLTGHRPTVRGLATDVAVPAVRRAARRHPRMSAVVADSWAGLPIGDGLADVVLSVFAPRNPGEAVRVLRPGGRWIVLAAEPDHLAGLRRRLGLLNVEPGKQQRLLDSLPAELKLVDSWRVEASLQLSATAVADLVAMGPNAFHARSGPDSPSVSEIGTETGEANVAVRVTVAVNRR